jgi:hypothetical protein
MGFVYERCSYLKQWDTNCKQLQLVFMSIAADSVVHEQFVVLSTNVDSFLNELSAEKSVANLVSEQLSLLY